MSQSFLVKAKAWLTGRLHQSQEDDSALASSSLAQHMQTQPNGQSSVYKRPTSFRFNDLPKELRSLILQKALVSDHKAIQLYWGPSQADRQAKTWAENTIRSSIVFPTALLSVNHELHDEGVRYLYSNNLFHFGFDRSFHIEEEALVAAHEFAEVIGKRNARLVKQVMVVSDEGCCVVRPTQWAMCHAISTLIDLDNEAFLDIWPEEEFCPLETDHPDHDDLKEARRCCMLFRLEVLTCSFDDPTNSLYVLFRSDAVHASKNLKTVKNLYVNSIAAEMKAEENGATYERPNCPCCGGQVSRSSDHEPQPYRILATPGTDELYGWRCSALEPVRLREVTAEWRSLVEDRKAAVFKRQEQPHEDLYHWTEIEDIENKNVHMIIGLLDPGYAGMTADDSSETDFDESDDEDSEIPELEENEDGQTHNQ